MDNYLICWRLCDVDGTVSGFGGAREGFPLGLNMQYRNRVLTVLPSEFGNMPDMQVVSVTIMKMVSRTSGGRSFLDFKGKSIPNPRSDDKMSFLKWVQTPRSRDGRRNHMLMRFDMDLDPLLPPHPKPNRHCPHALQFLLYRSALLDNGPQALRDHDTDHCYFDLPVGTFWGLLGLRTLNRWGIVPELVQEGLWFHHNPRPGAPRTNDYQPVTGTLPKGLYLKTTICVRAGRVLDHCYFRFGYRSDIVIDDPDEDPPDSTDPSDGASTAEGSENYQQGQALVQYRPDQLGEAPINRVRNRERSLKREPVNSMESELYGTNSGYQSSNTRRPRNASTYPAIPEELRFERLYIDKRSVIRPENIILDQDEGEKSYLLKHGSGIELDETFSASEKSDPRSDIEIYSPHSYGLRQMKHPRNREEEEHSYDDGDCYSEDFSDAQGRHTAEINSHNSHSQRRKKQPRNREEEGHSYNDEDHYSENGSEGQGSHTAEEFYREQSLTFPRGRQDSNTEVYSDPNIVEIPRSRRQEIERMQYQEDGDTSSRDYVGSYRSQGSSQYGDPRFSPAYLAPSGYGLYPGQIPPTHHYQSPPPPRNPRRHIDEQFTDEEIREQERRRRRKEDAGYTDGGFW